MHRVGQVLFIILNKKQQVIPVQVTEQIVRRTLNGEETSYTVAIPAREGLKPMTLEQIDGEVFTSIEQVKERMFENATEVINAITEKAGNVAKNRFDYSHAKSDLDESAVALTDDDVLVTSRNNKKEPGPGEAMVDLGDGTVAKVKLPDLAGM